MKFGLIGYPLSHSFSKKYFEKKIIHKQIPDCVYENFEISSIDKLSSLVLDHEDLRGFNVTIPYKEQIIPFLQYKDDVVEKTGACNCVSIRNHELHGFNTDVIGFEQSLKKKLLPHHNKALILGTGGAAKAVAYVLDKLGISFRYVTRSNPPRAGYLVYEDIDDNTLETHTLIVNTTPSGMYPHINVAPLIRYDLLTSQHYLFDLIYNPEKTLFLQKGEGRGAAIENGYEMLIIQAEESWKIWSEFML